MLTDKQVMVAYNFEGYWKDVGTIESLWEANMDLLSVPMPIDLHDKKWRIYAKNPGLAPHYIAKGAVVSDSLVTEGSEVYGSVQHSVLFAGVTIEEGASVIDSVIMPYAVIKRGAVVRRAIVAENAVIGAGCVRRRRDGQYRRRRSGRHPSRRCQRDRGSAGGRKHRINSDNHSDAERM